jgi:hypothetical protein
MEPLTAILGGLALGGIGSVLGASGNVQSAEQARRDIERAIELYGPEAAQAILQQRPELAGVFADPEAVAAQRTALQRMQQIGEKGYTVEEQAALNQIRSDEAARAAGEQAALRSQFAQRGVGGSGAELAQQMISAQGQAQRESQRGLDVAANAQRRAFQALQNQGALAGQMRTTGFAEAETRARAEDERRKFNAMRQAEQAQTKLEARGRMPQTEGMWERAAGGGLAGLGSTIAGYGAMKGGK